MNPIRDPTRHHPSTMSNSLRIIEAVAVMGIGVTAKEISEALHIPQATSYRLLNALVGEEYLMRTSDLRGFALGHRLGGLIAAVTAPTVSTEVRAHIDKLRSKVRFAVHLIGFQSASLRVLNADPDHSLRAERELVRHLHASAAGKLLLASRADWLEMLPRSRLTRVTPQTIVDLSVMRVELDTIRSTQLSTQVDELEPELACVAVPIRGPDGSAAGALCLAGPSSRTEALLSHTDAARRCATTIAPLLY